MLRRTYIIRRQQQTGASDLSRQPWDLPETAHSERAAGRLLVCMVFHLQHLRAEGRREVAAGLGDQEALVGAHWTVVDAAFHLHLVVCVIERGVWVHCYRCGHFSFLGSTSRAWA
jgi:hypothetical protein